MKRIMLTAFDDKMVGYGFRMLRSWMRFNPRVPAYYLDYGDMSKTDALALMGVSVLRPRIKMPEKRANFRDMMLWPFVEQLEWDKLCWVDADTMICRPCDTLWEPEVDFVGHSDRLASGPVLTCDYDNEQRKCVPGYTLMKFATGIWVTRNSDFLRDCYNETRKGRHGQRDSDLATHIVNSPGYSYYQLDANLWNFSRNIVPKAQYDGEHVYYKQDGRTYHPYVVGFSRVPVNGKDRRLSSPAIDQFYKERVENA